MNSPGCSVILGLVVAVCMFCWCSPTKADETKTVSKHIHAIATHTGISIDEIAAYLTLGRRSEHAEPTLVRWDQAEIRLGLTVSSNASAVLVEAVVVGVQRRFDLVNRQLLVCVRSWPGGSEITDGVATPIGSCGSSPTEIDLVIDVSDQMLLKEMEALPSVASDPPRSILRKSWTRIRQDLLGQPTWHFCNFGFATDAAAQKLIGGAGIVRIPAIAEKKALELAEDCSANLGYYFLGAIPILDKRGGESGTLAPDLLALLYSDEFQSGESRSEILTTLREAGGGN